MSIVTADWLPYHLLLKKPWQTSHGILNKRSGQLLRLQTSDGHIGWGDCAPLPEFGISAAAAANFAEETAQLDISAQRTGRSLNSWLSGRESVTSAAVNANLGDIFSIDTNDIAAALNSGFSILKIKVGVRDWQDEIARLRNLSQKLPLAIKLRLDANAAWEFDAAALFIAACAKLPIEGLEEPLRTPSQKALAKLQSLASFPIAVDESCHLIDRDFFHHRPVRRLILKPARHGGLLATMELALRAHSFGIECIVTSSLESNCGLLACAHLATAIAPNAIHGLGTTNWLLGNTGQAMTLRAGRILLPSTPGLGFLPDLDQILN